MKSSFTKPGAAAAPAAAPARPAPARPAAAPAKPAAAAPAKPAAAKPEPAAAPARPAPARPAPAQPTQPPAAATRPAPARPAPAARPTPVPPAGVNTNVGTPAQPRPAPRRAAAPAPVVDPEPELEVEETEVLEVEAEVLPAEEEANEQGGHVPAGSELAPLEGGIGNLLQTPLGQIAGELDASDFDIPRLGLTQSVGPLYEDHGFTPGDWVAGSSVILWQDGCEDLEITVLRVIKQWVENLKYGSDDMPRIFNTPQEAVQAGLQLTDWDREDAALPQANAMVLVKKNEGITDENGIFSIEGPDGALYAVLLWRISGVAYGRVMKKLTGALRQRLRAGLHTGTFLLSAKKEKGKINTYWIPVMNPGQPHDESMLGFVQDCAGEGDPEAAD